MWFFIILVLLSHGTRANTDGTESQLSHIDNYKLHAIIKVMSDFLLILAVTQNTPKMKDVVHVMGFFRILWLLLTNHEQKS